MVAGMDDRRSFKASLTIGVTKYGFLLLVPLAAESQDLLDQIAGTPAGLDYLFKIGIDVPGPLSLFLQVRHIPSLRPEYC